METKILKAVFGGGTSTVTNKRTRTDYGQMLEFVGVDLPDTFECIFSNSATSTGVGKKMIGSNQRVLIPDEYLATGQTIYAWVLVHDGEYDGRHMYSIRIPVADMPDTSPEEPTPVEQSVISQAITALNSAVTTTTQKAQEATESADRAEQAADGVEGYAERAESAKQAAESARDRATQAETSARTSAATATEKASEAISSATTASQSAITAENASESAQGYASASAESAEQASQSADTASESASASAENALFTAGKALDASNSASEAAQSASTAVQAKTDAETAKQASETAQGLAEQAQTAAETAQGAAEDARDEAQEIVDGITNKIEQIDSNTERIESLEDDRYKPYPTDSASGSIASFPDGADGISLKSCIVQIEPVQEGSGDPSPDNVRPITGWTGCEVQRTGENLWDEEWEIGGYASSTGGVWNTTDRIRSKADNYISIVPNTLYYSKCSRIIDICYYDADKTHLSSTAVSANSTFTTPSNARYMRFGLRPVYGTTYNHDISINYPSTDHDYHPYTGQTYPITFPSEAGTVFGAYVDVINGKLVITYYLCTPDNATRINYGIDSQSNLPYAYFSFAQRGSTVALSSRTLCSMYKAGNVSNVDKALRMWTSEADIWDSDLDVTSLDTVKAYFADLMIVYPLATPIEIQLDAHTINSLYGQNNLWADTGDTEVEYRADTKLYIGRLTEPDTDMVADANIVSGQYFMVGNNLYRATANIASGANVIVGTNALKVSLAQALNEINA